MEKYVPDIYQKDIYSINYKTLSSRGIKLLIFDLDNTMALITEWKPSDKLVDLFDYIKKKKFKVIIASNSVKQRVKLFADTLGVGYVSHVKKPKGLPIENYIKNSKYNQSEIAMIGDSMMDDVVCGNRLGITTILTDQLGKREFPIARIKRHKEKKIQKKLRDNNLFTKGRYYV